MGKDLKGKELGKGIFPRKYGIILSQICRSVLEKSKT